jgi:hypothetical protein
LPFGYKKTYPERPVPDTRNFTLLISENIYNFYIASGKPVKQYFNIHNLIFLDKKNKMNKFAPENKNPTTKDPV